MNPLPTSQHPSRSMPRRRGFPKHSLRFVQCLCTGGGLQELEPSKGDARERIHRSRTTDRRTALHNGCCDLPINRLSTWSRSAFNLPLLNFFVSRQRQNNTLRKSISARILLFSPLYPQSCLRTWSFTTYSGKACLKCS